MSIWRHTTCGLIPTTPSGLLFHWLRFVPEKVLLTETETTKICAFYYNLLCNSATATIKPYPTSNKTIFSRLSGKSVINTLLHLKYRRKIQYVLISQNYMGRRGLPQILDIVHYSYSRHVLQRVLGVWIYFMRYKFVLTSLYLSNDSIHLLKQINLYTISTIQVSLRIIWYRIFYCYQMKKATFSLILEPKLNQTWYLDQKNIFY